MRRLPFKFVRWQVLALFVLLALALHSLPVQARSRGLKAFRRLTMVEEVTTSYSTPSRVEFFLGPEMLRKCDSNPDLEPPSFPMVTRVLGYRLSSEGLTVFGEARDGESAIDWPLFREALHLASFDFIMMSLEPTSENRDHFVVAVPTALYETEFLRRMVAADYVTKAQLLGLTNARLPGVKSVTQRVAEAIHDCPQDPPPAISTNLFFFNKCNVDDLGEVEGGEGPRQGCSPKWRSIVSSNTFRRTLVDDDIALVPGSAERVEVVHRFADDYNQHLEEIERSFRVIRDLHNLYRLFWVVQSIQRDAETLLAAAGSPGKQGCEWLSEQGSPESEKFEARDWRLRGMETQSLGRFCVKNRHERILGIRLAGGVFIGSIVDAGRETGGFDVMFQDLSMRLTEQTLWNQSYQQVVYFWTQINSMPSGF